MCEWYSGKKEVKRFEVRVFEEHWMCPKEGCEGEMIPNGMVWPTGDPGIHHTCTKCKYTAAIHGRYPRTVHEKSGRDG